MVKVKERNFREYKFLRWAFFSEFYKTRENKFPEIFLPVKIFEYRDIISNK